MKTCVNHPDRSSRINLDGDELCQECADAWARGEGQAAYDDEDPQQRRIREIWEEGL